jgi:hypothetical protein
MYWKLLPKTGCIHPPKSEQQAYLPHDVQLNQSVHGLRPLELPQRVSVLVADAAHVLDP